MWYFLYARICEKERLEPSRHFDFSKYESETSKCFTAPFNNMRTPKFKAQPTNAFFATVTSINCSAAPPSFRLLPSTASLSELFSTI